ncbi:acetolactate synthase-1/2/3 large subunit [Micromonospora sp. Llam0]|uniref:thiamine pyrophosphate-dependent enzyme n=1 Tax=Micromonospora sp. Llam0 TaxID=2485143 RepID=UPI000F4608EE|nr:thiamine pyrophosphate-dependent enzyme [Micromonospora sp. Llam0]ROO52676.1 acetolactate synthase-1/2/3 large subunit [Micromonospora sp. Llam0]
MTAIIADAITDTLAKAGIESVFCVPGAHIDELCRSVAAHSALRLVTCRTEQGSGMMALGHARISNQVACCLTIPGPGLLSLAPVLATATAMSVPFLCVAGAIASPYDGLGLGLLHEAPPVLRHGDLLSGWHTLRPADVAAERVNALLAATIAAPHRPALLEVPIDVSVMDAGVQQSPARAEAPPRVHVDVDGAGKLLENSCRPLVVAGGGARGAAREIVRLADRLNAPIVPTVNGRCPTLDHEERAFPPTALRPLWEACDLVIAVGTRLASIYGSGRHKADPRPVIRIDADPRRQLVPHRATVGLTGDAADITRSLLGLTSSPQAAGWDDDALGALRHACTDALAAVPLQAEYTRVLHDTLADDAVVTLDSTQIAYHAMYALPLRSGRILPTAGMQGTLGSALPLAIGAKLAAPARQVACVVGDGGFAFGLPELATMAKERLGVTVIVFNDGAYGEVALASRHAEAAGYSELVNPDFVLLAESFGIAARRVSSPNQLSDVLRRELRQDRPLVVDVSIGPASGLASIFNVGSYGRK